MRRAYTLALGIFGLLQPSCGGSQAQRALAQAAVFTAIEVASAAMQAAADKEAERDANQRARLRATPTGNWSLVRSSDADLNTECEQPDGADGSESENPNCTTASEVANDKPPNTEAEGSIRVGGCIVCE